MSWNPYAFPQVISGYALVTASGAINTTLLTNIAAAQTTLSTVTAAASAVGSGASGLTTLFTALNSYASGLASLLAHDTSLFNNLPQTLGIYCQYGYVQQVTSAWTSGQVTSGVSGWYGTIMGSGQAIVTSGATYVTTVSGAVASGVSGLTAVTGVVVPGLNALTTSINSQVASENTAYSGGFSAVLNWGSAAGLYAEWKNPGGNYLLNLVGTAALVSGFSNPAS